MAAIRPSASAAESQVSTATSARRSRSASGSACSKPGSSSTMSMRVMSSRRIAGLSGEQRELDPQGGAVLFVAPVPDHGDRAFVLADDAGGDREAEAGTRAHLLGGEEGIEDPFLQSWREYGSGVAELGPDRA